MPKPTDAALRKLRRKFGNAQTAGRLSGKARFAWKVVKAPGKVRPPYRLYPVDALTGRDLTRQVGGVGFTPQPRKKVIRRASREYIASLTLETINRALVNCGCNQTHAARALGISPRTLTHRRQELLAQQAAEQNATVPSPAPPPPPAPNTARNPVTGDPMEPATPPDLGPDSDEESESSTTDDPPSCRNCPHAHTQGTVCPDSDCNCGDKVDVPPSSGGCNDKI